MLSSLWTIAKNAYVEIIRQPVYAVLLAMGMALIAISPAFTMFTLLEGDKLMVDMGLAAVLMLGVVMAVFASSQVISREIEQQTAGAVLSKPVGRFSFVLGKFLGVTLATFTTSYLLGVVLLITLRIGVPSTANWTLDVPAFLALLMPVLLAVGLGIYANYFYRWNFTSTAMLAALPLFTVGLVFILIVDPRWTVSLHGVAVFWSNAGQVVIATLLVALGVWVLSSVALAASTRLNVVMNAILCLMLFFVGMVSRYLFGRFAQVDLSWTTAGAVLLAAVVLFVLFGPLNSWVKGLVGIPALLAGAVAFVTVEGVRAALLEFGHVYAWVAERIIPSLEVFWVADNLMQKVPYIPWPYVLATAGYAVAFCAAMVALAAFLFERREVI